MSLFLTSDENVYGNDNTRTAFDNCIDQDFFARDGKNIALKEIFFDAKFPTLFDNSLPHVITIIDGKDHNISEFPSKYKEIDSFVKLFSTKKGSRVVAPMKIYQNFYESHMSEIDTHTLIEVHPRLNFAISYSFLSDLTINSKEEVIKLLNNEVFPFHNTKPLKILDNGRVEINSDINIFMSSNIMNILGFKQIKIMKAEHRMTLPTFDIINKYSDYVDKTPPRIAYTNDDILAKLEEDSNLYSNYRRLTEDKPQGNIFIEYKYGAKENHVIARFELDLFHQKHTLINYATDIRYINRVLFHSFLSKLKKDMISLRKDGENVHNIDDKIQKIIKDKQNMNLKQFGGLVTIQKNGEYLKLTPFHSPKYRKKFESFQQEMIKIKSESIEESTMLKYIFDNVFPTLTVTRVSFNDVLCKLFGANHVYNFDIEGSDVKFDNKLDYFKSARSEIFNSYPNEAPFALQFLSSKHDFFEKGNTEIECIKTQSDSIYLIKKTCRYVAESTFDMYSNFPKLIFVSASFIESTLFGSTQQKILNFFPIKDNHIGMIHHRFDNPIVLKMNPSSLFHINLLDENLSPLKAGLGVATLLGLKKTSKENMFPVTLISSDNQNQLLFPENTSNNFKNKLSFPLLFSNKNEWRVSLRSLAFPKVKNIYSDFFHIKFERNGIEWNLRLDNSFVNTIENLIFLLNKKIEKLFAGVIEFKLPEFSYNNQVVVLKSGGVDCILNGDMMQLLGFSFSRPAVVQEFWKTNEKIQQEIEYHGVTSPNLFLFQPQELVIISNIVEESYYAQSRPNILRIVSIPNQREVSGYNYVQFEQQDDIGLKIDRIDYIEVKILTRKGKLVEFVDECDVKIQLEFKRIN